MSEMKIMDEQDVEVGFFGTPIMNDAEAEEALKEIRQKEEEYGFWKDHYAEQLKAIEVQGRVVIDNNMARLQDYFSRVPHKATKTQETYALPSGKLVWKDQAPEFERDDAAIVEFLKKSGKADLVKVKEEPNWSEMKKGLKFTGGEAFDAETGEKVPGIKVMDRDRIFTIGK